MTVEQDLKSTMLKRLQKITEYRDKLAELENDLGEIAFNYAIEVTNEHCKLFNANEISEILEQGMDYPKESMPHFMVVVKALQLGLDIRCFNSFVQLNKLMQVLDSVNYVGFK